MSRCSGRLTHIQLMVASVILLLRDKMARRKCGERRRGTAGEEGKASQRVGKGREGKGRGQGPMLDCYACKSGGCGVARERRAGTADVTPISRKCHDGGAESRPLMETGERQNRGGVGDTRQSAT